MRLRVCHDATEVAEAAAERITRYVKATAAPVLGLATGRTPLATYAALRARIASGDLSFDAVRTFNLDEYCGLPPRHPASFHAYMRRELFDAAGMAEAMWHLPGCAEPGSSYEARIAAAGGIGLQLLGIGANGHVGFNEPGAAHDSRTRVVTLTEATRRANAPDFPAGMEVPGTAVTMGIATILAARSIVLLATGARKAEALARAIEGPVTSDVPASALREHPDVTVLCDPEAAAGLR